MARWHEEFDDEKRSYGAVFLLGVAMLLAGAIWAVWDDNIARRPWKKYQLEYFGMEVDQAKQALREEDQRLAADPTYQQVTRDLAEARRQLETGETARRLSQLRRQREAAKLEVDEQELNLRIVKSELEEAWYEYEHAVLIKADTGAPQEHIRELEEEKNGIERVLAGEQAKLHKIESEMAEISSVAQRLEDKLRDLTANRERLVQRLDQLQLHFGPFDFPRIPKIEQVVLNEFDRNSYDQPVARVDRCTSCHAGIDKPGFEDAPHPFRTHPDREELLGSNHPPDRFGCTPCHGGQGAAVNSVAQAHGKVRFWEHPLLEGEFVQASCITCHADVRKTGAEHIARGEKLFEDLGCHGCHLVQGYGELEKVGPFLRRIGAKVEPGWLVRWIENPHEYRPHTKMPNFFPAGSEAAQHKREQATAMAAYLLKASAADSEKWLESHQNPPGVNPTDRAMVERGRQLADSLGCRGCHGFAKGETPVRLGADKHVAPNLAEVAEKTSARWIYHWLKNPRAYSPTSRMPSLRLSAEEAAALTSYLLTLGRPEPAAPALLENLRRPEVIAEGEKLVRKYGCAGCHDIPGMEAESRIGVELSTFGSKALEELFFGNRTDIPYNWHDWTLNKLKAPRTYETERIEQVMPQFDLADEDIHALLTFLHSRTDHEVPPQYKPESLAREEVLRRGHRVVKKYNCVGCHVIDGEGGAIRTFYQENPTFAPPILTGEGAKVQSDWLFGFLKRPITLRPWLDVRMPTFGLTDEETNALVQYFLALDSIEIPFDYFDMERIPDEHLEAGQLLTSNDYFACFSCHQQGDEKPEGPREGWAPDLALAHDRLNPDWVVRWLRDPQAIQPGTKMPSFYNFEDDTPDGPEDVLGGSDERQVQALRDYIMSLGAGAAGPAAVPQAVPDGQLNGQPAASQDAGLEEAGQNEGNNHNGAAPE